MVSVSDFTDTVLCPVTPCYAKLSHMYHPWLHYPDVVISTTSCLTDPAAATVLASVTGSQGQSTSPACTCALSASFMFSIFLSNRATPNTAVLLPVKANCQKCLLFSHQQIRGAEWFEPKSDPDGSFAYYGTIVHPINARMKYLRQGIAYVLYCSVLY